MVSADGRGLWRDEGGAVMLEVTATIGLMLLVTFATVETGHLYYQWNVATKATQLGARLAAVSNPVTAQLLTLTGLEGGALPGDPMPAFDITCSGATASCTGGGYSTTAMNTLVFGRGDNQCNAALVTSDRALGMCDVFDRIRPQNVVIRYQYTGLGYAGRPGGAVPTVTVSLTGLTFDFVALNTLLGLGPITIPGLHTTITGEDLRGS